MLMAVDQRCNQAYESTNADLKSFIENIMMWRRLTSGERVIDIETKINRDIHSVCSVCCKFSIDQVMKFDQSCP